MRTSPLSLGIALILAIPACTETPQPVAPTGPTVAVAGSAPPQSVDLSPVAEPADVVGVVRWKSPGATLGSIAGCAGLPSLMVENGSRAALEAGFGEAFRGTANAKQLAAAVSLDAPFDVVIALDPASRKFQGMIAFSIGLSSLESAKTAAESVAPLIEIGPGTWAMGDKGGSRDLHCAIAVSAGSTPARLICGGRDRDVQALAPYLARTVPTLPAPTRDIHAELRYKPIDGRFGGDLRRLLTFLPTAAQGYTINEPHFDRALIDAATAVADEAAALTSDLDKITIDLGVDPSTCITASASLELRGNASWFAGTIGERPERTGPPPAIFMRVPKDADAASFSRGTDPARYKDILRALRGLAQGGLIKAKIGSEADQKAIVDLIDLKLGKDTNVVGASGHNDVPPPKVAPGKEPTEQQIVDTMLSGYGWYLIGFDEGPEATSKVLKDLVSLYGRKSLLDPIKKKMRRDADSLPTVKLVAAPAKLGKGALDVELKFEIPNKKKQPQDDDAAKAKKKDDKIVFTIHLLLMADGKNTWLGIGGNRDEVVKRLVATRSDAPAAGTIASRSALEPLRSGQSMGSGFVSLAVFTKTLAGLGGMMPKSAGNPIVEELSRTLQTLPHKGESPIFFSRQNRGGNTPRVEWSVAVGKGSLQDLGVLVTTGLRLANSAGLLPTPQAPQQQP